MTANPLQVRVVCYAGYKGEESPQRFFLGERAVEVEEVIDRWLDPEHHYFKLRGDDGGIYILRHDISSGQWEMTLFNSGTGHQDRLSST
jgi:hypothetical protein